MKPSIDNLIMNRAFFSNKYIIQTKKRNLLHFIDAPTCQRGEQISDLLDPQELLQIVISLPESYSTLPIIPIHVMHQSNSIKQKQLYLEYKKRNTKIEVIKFMFRCRRQERTRLLKEFKFQVSDISLLC